jgi:hypothetical protein
VRLSPGVKNVRFVIGLGDQTDNRLRQGLAKSTLVLAHPSITPSRKMFIMQGHSLTPQLYCSIPGYACQAHRYRNSERSYVGSLALVGGPES